MKSSQFGGGGGGGIGTVAMFPLMGPTLAMADGSVWLRSGTLVAAADAPAFAALNQFKVPGRRITALPTFLASVGPTQTAGNGAGILLAAGAWTVANPTSGSKMGLWRSTDWGVTWTDISNTLPQGCAVSAVAFGGGRFVCTGFDVSTPGNIRLFWSSNGGLSWTAGAANTFSEGLDSITGRSLRLTYANGRFIGSFFPPTGLSARFFASTDGSAYSVTPTVGGQGMTVAYANDATGTSLTAYGGNAILTIDTASATSTAVSCHTADGSSIQNGHSKPFGGTSAYTSAHVGGKVAATSAQSTAFFQKPLTSGSFDSPRGTQFVPYLGTALNILRLFGTAADATARMVALDNSGTLHVMNAGLTGPELSYQAPPGLPISQSLQGERQLWLDASSPTAGGWIVDPRDLSSGDFCGYTRGQGLNGTGCYYVRIK